MDGRNWKELFAAACEGDLELVKHHVKHGVDINYAHPEFLCTPLVACALAGHEDMALYLLEAGANPHLPSEFDSMIPLQAAQKAGLKRLELRLGTGLGVRGWLSQCWRLPVGQNLHLAHDGPGFVDGR